jgi:thiamine pyrophosphate-dependent acetolactate synthase large subunit-like protein
MAEALGCYAEYVEEPEDIRPALQRAWRKVEEGIVGFVNVKTDCRARAKISGGLRSVVWHGWKIGKVWLRDGL